MSMLEGRNWKEIQKIKYDYKNKSFHTNVYAYILQLQCRNVKIVVEIPVVETNRGGKFIDPFIVYVYCYW